jgi:ribosomal protein S18 acetylase RimI-like enzyme
MKTELEARVRLVPLSARDRDSFLEMARSHFRELNPDFVPQADWERHYFDRIMSNADLRLRWIQSDEGRAGFILFGIEDHRFLPRKTGAIYELYLAPAFRRRGIGSQCAALAISELRACSPSKVQIEIMEGNVAAEKLWESLGFRKVCERWVLKD